MSEEELNQQLIENWQYLSSNEKELLKKLGVKPKE